MTITNSLTSSSMSSSYDSNLIFQTSQTSSSLTSNLDSSLSSYQNRNQTALHKRAQQLRRWREIEENENNIQAQKSRTPTKVCFSPTTLFLSACAQRDFEECERLLSLKELQEAGGVNVTNCDGLTALHQACIDDNEPMVRWLLSKGANINCKDNEGWTPLHASANCGNLNIVKILVSNPQCDLFALNCDNELACDVCETKDCEDFIRSQMARILKNGDNNNFNKIRSKQPTIGGDINCENEDDENEEVFKNLRQQELKAIEQDIDTWIESSNTIDIKSEIERTRDPLSGATIIHVCAAKGYNNALERFLSVFSKCLDLDSFRDCDGYTALHAAAFWRQPETFETLLKYGANPDLLTEKTSDNIISSSVLELCKNDPKFIELIEVNKEKEKIAKESETQRKIFAKRQRETRRSTQGVKKEDLEKALKLIEISQNTTSGFPEIESIINNNDNINYDATKNQNTEDIDSNLMIQDDEEKDASLISNNNVKLPPKPPLPIKTIDPMNLTNETESSINNNNSNDTTNIITNNSNVNEPPESPAIVTMKICSTTPAEFARKRRIKRRATGIEDDSGHVLSPDLLSDSTNPLVSENIDAAFDVILSTPVNSVRASRVTRPVSNASSLSSLNSIRSNRDAEDNISTASSINSLASYGASDNTNNQKTDISKNYHNNNNNNNNNDTLATTSTNNNNNYKSISSTLNNNNENDAKESLSSNYNNLTANSNNNAISSDEIDYKKLCKQLLRENETLRRRIKELEESEKKREQEFNREKRALQRTISEFEEELKSMNDIKADNMRLKDENAALIRVISKLSKN